MTTAPDSQALTTRTMRDLFGVGIDGDFGAGGDVAALFHAAGDAEAARGRGFAVGPAELVGGGVEDGEQTGFGEVLAAEGERVHADRVGELVHEGLAGEVVRGGGERAIRAGAQRRFGRVVLLDRAGYAVRSFKASVAGVVVVMLPGDEGAVGLRRRL